MNFSKNSQKFLATTLSLLIIGVMTPAAFAAEPGTAGDPEDALQLSTNTIVVPNSLDLVEPDPNVGATFFGNGAFSADGLGQTGTGGTLQVEILQAGSTIEQAYLYASTFSLNDPVPKCDAPLPDIDLDGTLVPMTVLTNNEFANAAFPNFSLCSFKADVTTQVANKIGASSGIIDFPVNNDPAGMDGVGLVVIYSHPNLPENSIAILDGGLSPDGALTTLGLSSPLDKSIPGFSAVLSLGIGFSSQGSQGINDCGSGQFSNVDINGQRLTSCAGHFDDGVGSNGALFTIGGVGDDLNNPPNPNGAGGEDDELYNIADFLNDGITQINIVTDNPSDDDLIFLSIISITAKASVGEICGNGLDDDDDGLIDEGCDPGPPPTTSPVGGEFVPLDSAALLIAGMSANLSLIVPITAGIAGVGAYYIRSRMNKE